MSKVKGTVTGCGKGKFSYFITLDTKDGFYFNTKYEPKCGKGDVVGIEFDQKAENRGNVKKVVVLEKNSNGYEDTSKGGSGGGNSGGGTGGDRSDSIVWQHSQEMAIRVADLLVTAEAIKLPKNPDARRNAIEPLIDELTVRYFEDANDPKASKAYSESKGIEEDAAEPEPKSDDDGDDAEWSDDGDAKDSDGWDEWAD